MSALVVVEGATRTYAGGVKALDAVSLSVDRGELLALTGPSGSGKSTLLHLMGTLDRPTSGRVVIGGRNVATLSDRTLSNIRALEIGFVFQHFHLPAGARVLEIVADGLLYAGVPRRERLRRAQEAVEQVGLSRRLRHSAHELSGGERQRVAIARAVVRDPALLLADEPTGNLDTASANTVVELLCRLQSTGTAVVIVTHDQAVAGSTRRVVTLRDGRIVGDDAPVDVNATVTGRQKH